MKIFFIDHIQFLKTLRFYIDFDIIINPLHTADLFWHPLKTSENLWFFQGVSNEISGMKWVKESSKIFDSF